MKPWMRNVLVFVLFYGGLALLVASRSKTLDLLLVGGWLLWELVLSASFLTRLSVHRTPRGERRFRVQPPPRMVARWRRWLSGGVDTWPARH